MDPKICHGKPTNRGLRYTVESILELSSSEWLLKTLRLTTKSESIFLAALDFAMQLSQIQRHSVSSHRGMKFLIDTELPRRLAHHLRAAGLETTHTLDQPEGDRTTDQALITFSLTQHCVVVSKDSDFAETLLLRHPWK